MTRVALTIVLAGGEGRRMGGDKPMRRYGETTLVGRAIELARTYGSSVAVAVRDVGQVRGATAQLITDAPSIPGPMAGLASGLAHARAVGAEHVLFVPCDTPQLPQNLAGRLLDSLEPNQMVAVAASAGRLHPTCALWRVEALDGLSRYLATGRSSLRGFAESVGMGVVEWSFAEFDPFANANTREDLEALQPEAAA